MLTILIIMITGCRVSVEKQNIYDDNQKIVQQGDSFSYRIRKESEDSNEKMNVKYNGFNGMDTIWMVNSQDNGEINFIYNSTVTSGEFKGVLIYPNNAIETIIIGNQQGEKTVKLDKGKYRFKIVGKNANGEIEISVQLNQNVEITKNKE